MLSILDKCKVRVLRVQVRLYEVWIAPDYVDPYASYP